MNDLANTAIESKNLYHKMSNALGAFGGLNKGRISHPTYIDCSTMTCSLTGALNQSSFHSKLKSLTNIDKALVMFIDLDDFNGLKMPFSQEP